MTKRLVNILTYMQEEGYNVTTQNTFYQKKKGYNKTILKHIFNIIWKHPIMKQKISFINSVMVSWESLQNIFESLESCKTLQ